MPNKKKSKQNKKMESNSMNSNDRIELCLHLSDEAKEKRKELNRIRKARLEKENDK